MYYPIYRFFLNDALCIAAKKGDNAEVISLLNRGANIDGRGWQYMTPLLNAVEGEQTNTVVFLLNSGADIETANNLNTPLFWAITRGDIKTVQVLLKHRANLNAKDAWGKTVLARAREYKHPEIEKVLRQAGAKE